MNDTQAAELVTLEAIFCESFKRLGEDAFSFDFESTFYKAAFHVEARFSPDYPATPLARLEVSSPETHEEVVRMVVAKLRDIEREMVNPDLPYVYNLVSAMDEEQYQIADIGAETQRLHEQEEVPEDTEDVVIKINHGQLPGKPVTDENYRHWWEQFREEKGVALLEDTDWSKVDLAAELSPDYTGYEFFRRKQDEQ